MLYLTSLKTTDPEMKWLFISSVVLSHVINSLGYLFAVHKKGKCKLLLAETEIHIPCCRGVLNIYFLLKSFGAVLQFDNAISF